MSKITKGSDNVFKDLGFGNEDAANLKIRADLTIDLQKFIKSKNWTQAEAASFFGETQPRISNLMNGEVDLTGFCPNYVFTPCWCRRIIRAGASDRARSNY
jgi:predicted XRE-type DNA-binding protein